MNKTNKIVSIIDAGKERVFEFVPTIIFSRGD